MGDDAASWSNPSMEVLPWDSDWLGFPVARAVVCTTAEIVTAVAEGRALGIRLLYLIVRAAHESALAYAYANGAWMADVKLTYELDMVFPINRPHMQSLAVSYCQATICSPALYELAQQSSQYSRFRLDQLISDDACDELYAKWLQQCLLYGKVWTAERGGETVGLLAMNSRYGRASIELLSVNPAARQQGIGRGLLYLAWHQARCQYESVLQVATQEANQQAQQLYQRFGFQLVNREHMFHVWL